MQTVRSTADQIFTATFKYITRPAPGFAGGKGKKCFQKPELRPDLTLFFLVTFLDEFQGLSDLSTWLI